MAVYGFWMNSDGCWMDFKWLFDGFWIDFEWLFDDFEWLLVGF